MATTTKPSSALGLTYRFIMMGLIVIFKILVRAHLVCLVVPLLDFMKQAVAIKWLLLTEVVM